MFQVTWTGLEARPTNQLKDQRSDIICGAKRVITYGTSWPIRSMDLSPKRGGGGGSTNDDLVTVALVGDCANANVSETTVGFGGAKVTMDLCRP
ncbi:hypothetical protein QVD17_14609 [Tagetes erecta]|uniref:Uncharacterized protein n=1 Tax=Tagetes erecta TaxID=13708 RepID=A0AAD8P2R2_TARER|nr:hypothetical protein QVD17_14609 [Tagetes erecta]